MKKFKFILTCLALAFCITSLVALNALTYKSLTECKK